MSVQEWIVAAIGAATGSYLVWRALRRRLAGTCCGERECPAAKAMVDGLGEAPPPDVRDAE